MVVKIYWTMWAAFLVAAMALFLTGNLTMLVVVAFGFISFGMIFMGMMAVLPATISHPSPPKERTNIAPAYTKRLTQAIKAVRSSTARGFIPRI